MRKHNAENELAKRDYLAFLRNAGGRSEATLDQVAAALDRFEAFNRYRTFKGFRREQAISFKAHLAAQQNPATGKPFANAIVETKGREDVEDARKLARLQLWCNDATAATTVRNDLAAMRPQLRRRPAP